MRYVAPHRSGANLCWPNSASARTGKRRPARPRIRRHRRRTPVVGMAVGDLAPLELNPRRAGFGRGGTPVRRSRARGVVRGAPSRQCESHGAPPTREIPTGDAGKAWRWRNAATWNRRSPVHWEIKVPEVFERYAPGFDMSWATLRFLEEIGSAPSPASPFHVGWQSFTIGSVKQHRPGTPLRNMDEADQHHSDRQSA